MYIITMIDDGFLQLSAYATDKATVTRVVKSWHDASSSPNNDEGYIAVEEAQNEGENAERILQFNLDEEEIEDELDEFERS